MNIIGVEDPVYCGPQRGRIQDVEKGYVVEHKINGSWIWYIHEPFTPIRTDW
jgi:hypothetical protein